MRVLFVVIGTPPHLYPVVPLGWACRAAGHEVRVASIPAFVAASVAHTGLAGVGVGSGPGLSPAATAELVDAVYAQRGWPLDWAANLAALTGDQVAHLDLLGRYLIAAAAAMLDGLLDFARGWRPDLIVYDAASYAGAVAGAVLDVPTVRHTSGPACLPRLELRPTDGTPLPRYTRLFERYRVAVREPVTTVDLAPPALRLADHAPHLDLRCVPYNGPGCWPAELDLPTGRRPRICLTWGYTATQALGAAAADPFRAAIDAVAQAGAEALILTTAEQVRALAGRLPGTARAVAGVPLHLVLPYCDAIVHQGGEGTALTAAALGVPQLVVTRKPEEDATAARLAAVGAGIHLRHQDAPASSGAIRDGVDRLLSDTDRRAAAGRLRAEIERLPTPAQVVPALAAIALAPAGLGGG